MNEKKLLFHSERIYVPKTLRTEIINKHHDDERVGHYEMQKILELMRKNYIGPGLIELKKLIRQLTLNNKFNLNSANENDAYLLGMTIKIEQYIDHCAICRRNKTSRHKLYGHLTSLFIPKYKGSDIILNFVMGLLPSINWNHFICEEALIEKNLLLFTKNLNMKKKKKKKEKNLFDYIHEFSI